jgi:hypothetical protein
MSAITTNRAHVSQPLAAGLRIGIVVLTLATAQIHASLGGLMFTVNAIGYAAFAAAMVLPGPFDQLRWLVRYALIGFTTVTIAGWLAFGGRFELAYIDKAIEVALIGLVLVESWIVDGGPVAVARRIGREVASLVG